MVGPGGRPLVEVDRTRRVMSGRNSSHGSLQPSKFFWRDWSTAAAWRQVFPVAGLIRINLPETMIVGGRARTPAPKVEQVLIQRGFQAPKVVDCRGGYTLPPVA